MIAEITASPSVQLAEATGTVVGKQHADSRSWQDPGRHVLVDEGHAIAALVHIIYAHTYIIAMPYAWPSQKAESHLHPKRGNISFDSL